MIKNLTTSTGIRVVVDTMPQVRSITLGLWFGCGSREDGDIAGRAHFIEHMLFKGTSKRSAKQLALDVDFIGGQMNAFTSSEYTCYYMKVLDRHIEKAFELLSDMLLNSTFSKKEIKKEQQIILQEHDMYEDNPEEYIQDKYFSSVWKNHPLGRKIIGNRSTIKKITQQTLLDYKQKLYTPDNLVVSVAGNVQLEEVAKLVEIYLAKLTGSMQKPERTAPEFSQFNKKINKTMEQVQIIWGVPGICLSDKRWYKANILNNILGASASSRLFQQIREDKALAYFIYSNLASYTDTGLFSINAGVSPLKVDLFLSTLTKQIKLLIKDDISENELQKAKEQITSNLLMGLESSNGRMNRIGRLSIMNMPILPIDEIIAKVNNITKNDVLELAKDLFEDKKTSILILGPKK